MALWHVLLCFCIFYSFLVASGNQVAWNLQALHDGQSKRLPSVATRRWIDDRWDRQMGWDSDGGMDHGWEEGEGSFFAKQEEARSFWAQPPEAAPHSGIQVILILDAAPICFGLFRSHLLHCILCADERTHQLC